MDSKLLNHFTRFRPLSIEEVEAIDETMRYQEYGKGTILLKEA
ncbi:hypothetical protein [Segetibacter sp. 3557_3]|nr:hypothetical protein [Segetibacter sp. 3557_3]